MNTDKIKIVLADDNKDFCEILAEYLNRQSDMEVIGTANNGTEAYEMILEKTPDVVILDVIMPHLDGIGVIEKLKKVQMEKDQYL